MAAMAGLREGIMKNSLKCGKTKLTVVKILLLVTLILQRLCSHAVQALEVEGGALVFSNSFAFKDQQILARAGVHWCFVSP